MVSELEGLQRGGVKPGEVVDAASMAHAERVALSAKEALAFLRQRLPSLRCVTTRGSTLNSTVFTYEDDGQQVRQDPAGSSRLTALCPQSEPHGENFFQAQFCQTLDFFLIFRENKNCKRGVTLETVFAEQLSNWSGVLQDMLNDDKILTTCLNLSRTSSKDEVKPGKPIC